MQDSLVSLPRRPECFQMQFVQTVKPAHRTQQESMQPCIFLHMRKLSALMVASDGIPNHCHLMLACLVSATGLHLKGELQIYCSL